VLRDVGIAVALFALLGVLGALVWWQVTPLAEFTRTADNATMDEEQLGIQVASDGWFFVIAVCGGVAAGIVFAAWRHARPVLAVVLVALGGLLATAVMTWLGRTLGPPDPDTVIRSARVGAHIPMQLETHARGLRYVWSIAALLGAVGVLWGTDRQPQCVQQPETDHAPGG
jgi:xanthosine utilization system XapX-like protein